MNEKELLEQAWSIAEQCHNGQLYGTEPYLYHIQRVYNRVDKLKWSMFGDRIVSVLHDVVEDSNYSFKEIERIFGNQIYVAVFAITRSPELETYEEYIYRDSRNMIARNVKACDLLDNLSNCYRQPNQYGHLINRYENALIELASGG